jgi:hypothetical protein
LKQFGAPPQTPFHPDKIIFDITFYPQILPNFLNVKRDTLWRLCSKMLAKQNA